MGFWVSDVCVWMVGRLVLLVGWLAVFGFMLLFTVSEGFGLVFGVQVL